jgi:hypothetical protein
LLERPLKRKKRITDLGKGYRDALIWEPVKGLVKPPKKLIEDPSVVLITANHKDFCGSDLTIHTDLIEELETLGLLTNLVVVVNDFDACIDKYYKSKLKILTDIRDDLIHGKYEDLDIKGKVSNLVFGFLENREFAPEDLGLPEEFENPSVTEIEETFIPIIEEVRVLSESEIIINGIVEVECTLDTFIFKADYYAMADKELPYIWDWDWNDHYFAGSIAKTLKFKFFLAANNSLKDSISSEIELEGEEVGVT